MAWKPNFTRVEERLHDPANTSMMRSSPMDGILLAAGEFGCEPATGFEGNGSSCIGCVCSEQGEDSQAWFWPGFLFLAWHVW